MENNGWYFKSTDSLKAILDSITEAKLKYIGAQMEEIAHRRYTWKGVVKKYELLFV